MSDVLQAVTLLAGIPEEWAQQLGERLQRAGRKTTQVADRDVEELSRWKERGELADAAVIAALAHPKAASLDDALNALEIAVAPNTQTPMRLINAILAEMLPRGTGKILLVTWNSAAITQPEFAAARSTARAIAVYAESLRPALKCRGIALGSLLLAPRSLEQWHPAAATESVCKAAAECLEQMPLERRLRV